jgi:hypothetical protein
MSAEDCEVYRSEFEIDVRDTKKIDELDEALRGLVRRILEELEKMGFNVDFYFVYNTTWWESEVAEKKIFLGIFTVDGKRYSIPLAKLTRYFTNYSVSVKVYSIEEALCMMEEVPR